MSDETKDILEITPDQKAFEFLQRKARMYAQTDFVPPQFRAGRDNSLERAMGNCIIAMEIAERIGAGHLAVMQNLYIVNGRPSWSSQFLISVFNKTPGFTKLRYEFEGDEDTDGWKCRAYATETTTDEVLYGTWVSIDMAKREGWHGKNGSKWKTMPEQMLRYRAAAFFIRTVAPEISMGMLTEDESQDMKAEVIYDEGSKKSLIDTVIESAGELPQEIKENPMRPTVPTEEGKNEGWKHAGRPLKREFDEEGEPEDIEVSHDLFKNFKRDA